MVLKGSSDNICVWQVADFVVSLFLLFFPLIFVFKL